MAYFDILRVRVTQNGLQLPLFFFSLIKFFKEDFKAVTEEVCDQDLTHSLDIP